MQELNTQEVLNVSGGDFGWGQVPGGGPESDFGNGITFDHSFSNGWSLSAGFNSTERGFEISYVW